MIFPVNVKKKNVYSALISLAQPSCMVDSDCAASHCAYLGLYPFCRTSLANGQSYCDCAGIYLSVKMLLISLIHIV